MLCVDLPILPIPSFHLPNIIIDLSNINLGIDFVLPDIQFVSKRIPLPKLPDFPPPQDFVIDITLPVLPTIPPPPPLPELPELTLDIDFRLPTLPPAPKIPKISPAIKVVVELLDLVGTIWCLFKSKVGLVAEQWVKTRIEQMTQRKQDIFPFDDLKIDFDPSPVQWVDYKLTSYIDIKAEFSPLYDAIDSVVSTSNERMNKGIKGVESSVTKGVQAITPDIIGDIGDAIDQGVDTDVNIDLNPFGLQHDDVRIAERTSQKIDQYLGWTYEEIFASLDIGLRSMLDREEFHWLHPDMQQTLALLHTPTGVMPNIEQIEQLRETVNKDLLEMRDRYQWIQEQTEDFDTFVEGLPTTSLVANTTYDERSYATSLFSVDPAIREIIERQPHPTMSQIDMQRQLVDGFANSLQENSHYDLQMSELEHEQLQQYFWTLQAGLATIPSPENNIDLPLNVPLLAQTDGWWGWGQGSDISQVDFTQYINGFFVPGKDDDYHNVIAWDEKGIKLYNEKHLSCGRYK